MPERKTTTAETPAERPDLAPDVAEAREAQEADVPGGKYKTADGRWVDANGNEITASGKPKKSDD